MQQLKYSYKTHISFSESIFSHHFLLRCTPRDSEAQRQIEHSCSVMPTSSMSYGTDSFDNKIITGYIGEFHNYFEFFSEGIVELYNYKIHETLNPIFLYPSQLTKPMHRIKDICKELNFNNKQSTHEKIFTISKVINDLLKYVPGVTSVYTSAEDALSIGQGVCQDFAHLMISICRECGIPARYVTGFMVGEGFTHAWIEYCVNDYWYGFDPTNNRPAEPGYLKIAHGRDFTDCAIDKGVFKGLAMQNLEVHLKVDQIQQ